MAQQHVDALLEAFRAGEQDKRSHEESTREEERLKLAKQAAKLQHDQAKLQEALFKFKTLSGTPAPRSPDLASIAADPMRNTGQPQEIVGHHPSIDLGGGISATPPSMEDLIAQVYAQKQAEAQGGANVQIDPAMAEHLGLPTNNIPRTMGMTAPQVTHVPEGALPGIAPEGGTMENGLLTAMTNQYLEQGRNARNAADNASAETRATITASGMGGDMVSAANALHTGQAKLSDFPQKQRSSILAYMRDRGMGVMDNAMKTKLGQFTSARGVVDQVSSAIQEMNDAVQSGDTWQSARAFMQYENEISALSRMVGRAAGEKGVFTDQDKADFAKIIGTGPALTAVDIMNAALNGVDITKAENSIAADRLRRLREFMQRVHDREFQGFQDITGLTLPGAGGGAMSGTLPDGTTWTAEGQQ